MSKKTSNKFNFFVPATFEKAKDGTGKGLTKIKGIASSSVQDSDEEILFPLGFDYTPFLSKGILNYNHQSGKTSKAIVGEPTHAEVINDGKDFYIEGVVYPNEEGTSIVEQAEIFEKYSPNRRFGFSIEGQAIERDPLNPKKITKARITGCAITACPKNPNTLMDIVKGEYQEPFIEETEEEGDEKKKSVTTETIAPGTPESVDGVVKKTLTKSEVYEDLLKSYGNNLVLIKEIYNFVKSVNVKLFGMVDNKQITKEALDKAKEMLDGISKGTASNGVEDTPATAVAPAATENVEAKAFAKSLHAEGKSETECIEGMIRKGYSLAESGDIVKSVIQEVLTAGAAPAAKVEDLASITKSLENTISKSLTPINDVIAKGFGAVNELFKSQEKTTSLLKSELQTIIGRLEKVEQTPLPRKSLTAAGAVEKFAKSEDGAGADGVRVVSISDPIQKSQFVDEVFEAYEKATNGLEKSQLSEAVQYLESTNFMEPAMQKKFNVQLVK